MTSTKQKSFQKKLLLLAFDAKDVEVEKAKYSCCVKNSFFATGNVHFIEHYRLFEYCQIWLDEEGATPPEVGNRKAWSRGSIHFDRPTASQVHEHKLKRGSHSSRIRVRRAGRTVLTITLATRHLATCRPKNKNQRLRKKGGNDSFTHIKQNSENTNTASHTHTHTHTHTHQDNTTQHNNNKDRD